MARLENVLQVVVLPMDVPHNVKFGSSFGGGVDDGVFSFEDRNREVQQLYCNKAGRQMARKKRVGQVDGVNWDAAVHVFQLFVLFKKRVGLCLCEYRFYGILDLPSTVRP